MNNHYKQNQRMDTEEYNEDERDDGEKLYQLDTDTLMEILESASSSQKKTSKKAKNKKTKKQKQKEQAKDSSDIREGPSDDKKARADSLGQ